MSAPDLLAGLPPPRPSGAPVAHPCAVCGAPHAPWGFGLTRAGGVLSAVWTCGAHRAEGEAMAPARGADRAREG